MGRVERDQLLPKDGKPELPAAPDNYTPGVKGGKQQADVSPAILADPNLNTRMAAVRDMARSAAGRMPAPMIPPGETASGGEQAVGSKPWNPTGRPVQQYPQQVPSIQEFARQHFPNIASNKYITPAELKMVQQMYKMELARGQAAGRMGGQAGRGGPAGAGAGAPTKLPSNLPGMIGHAALHPELYTKEAIASLKEAALLVYGKDGNKGRKGPGVSSKVKSAVAAKMKESLGAKLKGANAKGANPNPEEAFPGLKGNQMGAGVKGDVIQSTMMGGEFSEGLLAKFKTKPVEAWFEARALERAVLADVNPKLSAVLKNFLDKFRPDPQAVLDAMEAGTIDRQQANDLLEFLLTDEEQAAMGVGNDTGGPPAKPAQPNPMMQGTNAGGGGL